jgi:Mor family transcriptional regulator
MTDRRTPWLTQVIRSASDLIAADPRIPLESRAALRATAVSVLHQQFATLVGGERVYAPRRNEDERQAQRARILAALAAGDSARAIARREACSLRWVYKLRSAAQCTGAP